MRTTGKFSWAILLCKFRDHPEEPHPPKFFEDLISGKLEESLSDYWTAMSYSNLDMSNATVYGWYNLLAVAQDQAFLSLSRWEKTQKCIDTAEGFFPGSLDLYDGVLVIVNAAGSGGGYAGDNRILLDPGFLDPTGIAHEMGHLLGLDHSFDTNSAPWDAYDDNRPGAYGDSLDIMSAKTFASLPATFQGTFGESGPGLNAVTREGFGWLPQNKIWKTTHNAGEDWSVQIEVAALDSPVSPFNLMLKITSAGIYNGIALAPLTYAVEFRQKTGWDAGMTTGAVATKIAPGAVAIHMIRDGDHPRIAWSSGNKAGWNTQGWVPGDSFVDLARSMAINIVWIAEDNSAASVFIVAGTNARLPMISVRKSLAHKFDLTKGLRAIKPSPPFPSDSLRARLLDNPPQFAP
jgi:hypothetical protein